MNLSGVKAKVKRQLCSDCGRVRDWLFPFAVKRLNSHFSFVCSECRQRHGYDEFIKHWPS